MNIEAVSKDTISERLATLAGAISALEAAIDATDKALQATSADDLAAAISDQNKAANSTLELKQKLQKSFPLGSQSEETPTLYSLLSTHPEADELLPQYVQIENRLKSGQLNLSQQALVVNKMQAINRQLLGVLTDVDNHGYDQQGVHSETDSARTIAQA